MTGTGVASPGASPDWPELAHRLAETLIERGDLHDPAWRAAIAAVPRHRLVPAAWEQDGHGVWHPVDTTSADGMALVYSPRTLVTALEDRGGHQVAVSSSTKPDLMVRMLEVLAVRDGHRVLEIGTGTGYNAALLTHRLGAAAVFSIDVDPDLVHTARRRLAEIGFEPTLVATDGVHGLPEHAPYDRIVTTCSTSTVPWVWAQQLAPEGRMLVDLKVNDVAGNLVDLRRLPDRVEGRFTDRWAAFMTMRHPGRPEVTDIAPASPAPTVEPVDRITEAPPQPWSSHRVVWLLAQFTLPRGIRIGMNLDPDTPAPTAATLAAPDGSRVVVELAGESGRHRVHETGPTSMWASIERAYEQWTSWGEPAWPRLGVTVTADAQRVWIDDPSGPRSWTITG